MRIYPNSRLSTIFQIVSLVDSIAANILYTFCKAVKYLCNAGRLVICSVDLTSAMLILGICVNLCINTVSFHSCKTNLKVCVNATKIPNGEAMIGDHMLAGTFT